MNYCTKCVMPSTRPGITLNEKGECSACQSYVNRANVDYANYLWFYDSFPLSIVFNYFQRNNKRTIEIVTDQGSFNVDLLNNSVKYNDSLVYESEKRIKDTYFDQINFFIENVIKKGEKFNTITEANAILKLCIKD